MDINDYNEDHLSTVGGNCKYLSYKQLLRPAGSPTEISCTECRSWTGSGCARKQFDSIASELRLD